MEITTLIENTGAPEKGLPGEHGLSFFLEMPGVTIVFDTGASSQFIVNAKKMGKNIASPDYLVMSHGHYDHAGGYPDFKPLLGPTTRIILGQGFFKPKYRYESGQYHYNGIPFGQEYVDVAKIDMITDCHDYGSFVVFKNQIPAAKQRYVVEVDGVKIPDGFTDEIFLGIKHDDGLIVVVGCCHMKIENLIDQVHSYGYVIKGLIGGIHESSSDDQRILEIVNLLKRQRLEILSLNHCTGSRFGQIARAKGLEFIENHTGKKIII